MGLDLGVWLQGALPGKEEQACALAFLTSSAKLVQAREGSVRGRLEEHGPAETWSVGVSRDHGH